MSRKRCFQYKEIEGNISSSVIVKKVMEGLIGTMFIEKSKFEKQQDKCSNVLNIGRTFFSDRAKSQHPVNDSFVTRFGYLCTDVLHGESEYDPKSASFNLDVFFRDFFCVRTYFLLFSDDDDEHLRSAKASAWIELLTKLFFQIKETDIVLLAKISSSLNDTLEDLFLKIKEQSKGTPAEVIMQKFEKDIGYPGKVNETVIASNCFHEKKDGKFSFDRVFKEYRVEFEESLPLLFPIFSKYGVTEFITKVMDSLKNENLTQNTRQNIASGVIASILRTAYFFDRFDGELCSQTIMPLEDELAFLSNDFSVSIQTILSLTRADSLLELSSFSNKAFFRKGIGECEKSAIAFVVLAIYFTDLYLIISKYPQEHEDMIRYKTNADVCNALSVFTNHVSFSSVPVAMDIQKRRIDICLSCDEANSHKAAALFVNEFERALSGFEDIFAHLGLQLYYVKASVSPYGQDNITNHNFEAYTPTLMPLLSGGHLYSTSLVFIRELVQNAIDSVSVRKQTQGTDFDTKISISLSADTTTGQIYSLTIKDNGMGMGRMEIERYLTSIGRSYYTAGDFKKLNLSYRPISSFGIGFLSCFLVC